MENNLNDNLYTDSTQELKKWLDPSSRVETSTVRNESPRNRPSYHSDDDSENIDSHVSVMRTGKAALATVVVISLAGTIGVGLEYKRVIDLAHKPAISIKGSTLDAGKAEIQSINMDIAPITLSTAKTNAEVSVGYQYKILNIPVPGQAVRRSAQVETHIRLDPKIVKINYDPNTKELIYAVPDFALTAEVIVPADMTDTTAESGSIITFGPDVVAAAAKTIAGMNHIDAADVPLIGMIAKGTMNANNALNKFAAMVLATRTDDRCTRLIPKIVGFNDILIEEVKEVTQGQILNPDAAHSGKSNGLSSLMNLKPAERQKIMQSAKVIIPTDYTISPDATKIAQLKAYEKSGVFTDTTVKMDCGVAKDFKLTKMSDVGTK